MARSKGSSKPQVDAVDDLPQDDQAYELTDDTPPGDDAVDEPQRDDVGEVVDTTVRTVKEETLDVCLLCGSTSFRSGECAHTEVAHVRGSDPQVKAAILGLQSAWQLLKQHTRTLRRAVLRLEGKGLANIEITPVVPPVVEIPQSPAEQSINNDSQTMVGASVEPENLPIVPAVTPTPSSARAKRKKTPEGQTLLPGFAIEPPAPAIESVPTQTQSDESVAPVALGENNEIPKGDEIAAASIESENNPPPQANSAIEPDVAVLSIDENAATQVSASEGAPIVDSEQIEAAEQHAIMIDTVGGGHAEKLAENEIDDKGIVEAEATTKGRKRSKKAVKKQPPPKGIELWFKAIFFTANCGA